MSNEEIAKELTLAIVEKIRSTDTTTTEKMNASLALEVAKAYTIILENIPEVSKSGKASSVKGGMV